MESYNNSLRYFREYYDEINWCQDKKSEDNEKAMNAVNRQLVQSELPEIENLLPFQYEGIDPDHTFNLLVQNPGLIIGSGIPHGAGFKGEIKMGFHFDFTTGLPVLPGSSVKGALRSLWPLGLEHAGSNEDDAERKAALREKSGWAVEFLQQELKELESGADWTEEEVKALEKWLFGSYDPDDKPGPMSGRIHFHDAMPVNAVRVVNQDTGKYTDQYLGLDFITPHEDPLKDPNPLQILKVLPKVEYRFQFKLQEYKFKNHTLNASQIKDLFERLIQLVGVGAKTNVGYGHFEPLSRRPTPEERGKQTAGEPEKEGQKQDKKPKLPEKHYINTALFGGEEVVGFIKQGPKKKPDRKRIEFMVLGNKLTLSSDDIQQFEIDDLVVVKITKASVAGGIATFKALRKLEE